MLLQFPHGAAQRQRGLVLVTSLLMLVVVTILAVGLFRSFGVDEKIAGSVREKNRALGAAETAEQYAEFWLVSNGNATTGAPCIAPVTVNPQVCNNALAAPSVVPWSIGTSYVPTTPTPMNTTTPGNQFYAGSPAFYINYLGLSPSGQGSIYQVDAVGYGGSADTVAIVESTYLVQTSVKDLGQCC